jgi:hypothetical protein
MYQREAGEGAWWHRRNAALQHARLAFAFRFRHMHAIGAWAGQEPAFSPIETGCVCFPAAAGEKPRGKGPRARQRSRADGFVRRLVVPLKTFRGGLRSAATPFAVIAAARKKKSFDT